MNICSCYSVDEKSTHIMLNVLSKCRDGFKVCHLNARSLNQYKLDYLKHIFSNSGVDVICVSETWFRPDIIDTTYNIPNCTIFRNDRVQYTWGGGIAIYCKSTLN